MPKPRSDKNAAARPGWGLIFNWLCLGVMTAGIMLALALSLVASHVRGSLAREAADYAAEHALEAFSYRINGYALDTRLLEGLLQKHGGALENFREIATVICERDRAIVSVQLAPGGIVAENWPESIEAAGTNLFSDQFQGKEAAAARDAHAVRVSGPFGVAGSVLKIMRPFYLKASDGSERFWGFINLAVRLDQAFDFKEFAKGFNFELSSGDAHGEMTVCLKDGTLPPDCSRAYKTFLGRAWSVKMSQKAAFANWAVPLAVFTAVLLLFAMLAITGSFAMWLKRTNRGLKHSNQLLEQTAMTDALTGISNRAGLEEWYKRQIKAHPGDLLLFAETDVDDFKRINDVCGHGLGDETLIALSQGLDELARQHGGIAARTGGDEFVLCVPVLLSERAVRGDLEYFAHSRHPLSAGGTVLYFRISMGVARAPEDAGSFEDLQRCADAALYHTKTHGKHGISFFDRSKGIENRQSLGFSARDFERQFPCGQFIYRKDGGEEILFVSESLWRDLGYSSQADFARATGNSFRGLVHPDDLERVEQEIEEQQRAHADVRTDYVKYRIKNAAGQSEEYFDAGKLVHSEYFGDIYYVILIRISGRRAAFFK